MGTPQFVKWHCLGAQVWIATLNEDDFQSATNMMIYEHDPHYKKRQTTFHGLQEYQICIESTHLAVKVQTGASAMDNYCLAN